MATTVNINPILNVIEVCKVAPTTPLDSTVPTSLPLTSFDLLFLRLLPVERLFFYETSHSSKTTFLDIVLPKLKHSLSITLHHYLPLAGNLTWPDHSDTPILQYLVGDAVSLTIAETSEANKYFYHLTGNNFHEAKELKRYVPNLEDSETRAPVMALQITLFPNAGFSIGYAIHHGAIDGKSVATFMYAWASICRQLGKEEEDEDQEEFSTNLTPELTPFYDRSFIEEPTDLDRIYLRRWLVENGHTNKSLKRLEIKTPPVMMLGTFQLTKANIENLKKWVQTRWELHKHIEDEEEAPINIHFSTFSITSAYTWVCLIRAQKLSTEKAHLEINVDCRARLEPPIPSTYFGNCITGLSVDIADSNELKGEDGVARAAKAIGEAIGSFNKGGGGGGVPKSAQDLVTRICSVEAGSLFVIAGSPYFKHYNTDFGWGRPRSVKLISIDKGATFSLSDSRDGIQGGIEIGVALKKHEIEAFATLFADGLEA